MIKERQRKRDMMDYYHIIIIIVIASSSNCLIVLRLGALALLGRSSFLGRGLGKKDSVDVGKNTTSSDSHTTEKLVKLFIVADSKLDVARDNASLLVVTGSVTSKLKDLSSKVLKDGSKVHWGTSTNTSSILAFLQETSDSSDWELKTSLGRLGC
jgi:hypothetical protein